jgi:hypothetical protein
MNRPYRIALFCGATPLIVGTSIFVLWLFTRWEWLKLAGAGTLVAGALSCLAGVVLLSWSYALARERPELTHAQAILATLCGIALLLVNFPAAAGILYAVEVIESAYVVEVQNQSAQPLDSVRVYGGGCDISLGSIQPHGTARRTFWIKGDGTLAIQVRRASNTAEATVEGYATNGLGGHSIVSVSPSLSISVREEGPKRVPD